VIARRADKGGRGEEREREKRGKDDTHRENRSKRGTKRVSTTSALLPSTESKLHLQITAVCEKRHRFEIPKRVRRGPLFFFELVDLDKMPAEQIKQNQGGGSLPCSEFCCISAISFSSFEVLGKAKRKKANERGGDRYWWFTSLCVS
jgi:phage/plasmid primase-like uncharacterized protein